MRRTNAVAAGLVAIVTLGMAANAGQTPFKETPSTKFRFDVTTDKRIYAVNAPIKMTLTLKNISAKPITLMFPDGKRYEFEISKGERSLWSWSHNRSFMQEISTQTLGAGKTVSYTEVYQPGTPTMPALAPGKYDVTAYPALTNKNLVAEGVTFKVVAAK